MAFLPLALQLLPLIPALIDNAIKIANAIRHDPMTPEDVKAELDALEARLLEVVERVKNAPLPTPSNG